MSQGTGGDPPRYLVRLHLDALDLHPGAAEWLGVNSAPWTWLSNHPPLISVRFKVHPNLTDREAPWGLSGGDTPKTGFFGYRGTHTALPPFFPSPPDRHCDKTSTLDVTFCHAPMLGEPLPLGAGNRRIARAGTWSEARDGGLFSPVTTS